MKLISFYDQDRFKFGSDRLRKTLDHWGWGDRLTVFRELPKGCPIHCNSPYAFKPYLFDLVRREGANAVIWIDTSIRFLHSPSWMESILKGKGFLMVEGWYLLRYWISDQALDYFEVRREELSKARTVFTGLFGLDFRHRMAHTFLDEWLRSEQAGCFQGSWTNLNGSVSVDPTVRGHRHDQSCANMIALKLGLEAIPFDKLGLSVCHPHAFPKECLATMDRAVSPGNIRDIHDKARIIIDRGCTCRRVNTLLGAPFQKC